jgi:hypothetical protein
VIAYINCHFRPPIKMAINPYNVAFTAVETHSVNSRRFVVFDIYTQYIYQKLQISYCTQSIYIYNNCQEECARIRENVPYVKV